MCRNVRVINIEYGTHLKHTRTHIHTHTHRDAGSGGGVAHGQDGDVLGSVQPPDGRPRLADPLHHRHIMFPVWKMSHEDDYILVDSSYRLDFSDRDLE